MTNKVWAVVPSAGIGSRMQADRPKQYLLLNNKPVIFHTLQRLVSHPLIEGVVVALSANDPYWPSLDLPPEWPIHTTLGGEERAVSVSNALQLLQTLTERNPWVLVHDAARPCIRHSDIDNLINQLANDPVGGILGVPLSETVKRVSADNTIESTVDRSGLWRASTPQMFRLAALTEAMTQASKANMAITDEASAMEFMGVFPKMVAGHADNIKITLPQDLALAALFMNQQENGGVE
ncbi:2-C-methyl-D-erythritol 4-phosphate cytidylyltransferase [Methylophaga pinxianii]|uniref:2-C-methyl-D-erythritol 4-phosphate cytidylyltransferase n=1 Tax=Methylophaga pinxianii TaxID=2881052 RepID=UPI001CF5B378|nr:2-C-methyl-D-erythritol 4-phosphate cytidylyltransferase [Methylophaga pinxianii]MCB2427158.1 2-C-methyl-D-erythritol 4-phosphate cytidylyltransferase [Methylophaga pinxianii]UPH44942.1 2-C-methyl-D-erythritol 4-phosphate cytidylyltransferase [Methylophaga pinxianii]